MTKKKEWQQYLMELKSYEREVKRYIKELPDTDFDTQDEGGGQPPLPDRPKPPTPPNP